MSALTKEAIADSIKDISSFNQSTLDSCISSLQAIKESKQITESMYKDLTNVIRELDILKDVFVSRLFYSLKRGDRVI